jgi:hypothetical protein
MVVAARRVNPEETKGLAESLQVLRDQPYGPALLAVVALGLAAYGVYMIVLARYKKMIRWDRPVKA